MPRPSGFNFGIKMPAQKLDRFGSNYEFCSCHFVDVIGREINGNQYDLCYF